MLLLRRQSRLICSISKKMGNKTDWVEAQIKGNKVVVFSKTYCPFCDMAKKALAEVGLSDYLLYELDNRDDGEEIMDILKRITGGRTVPRVFIGGKFVGGGSEVRDFQKSGELVSMLKSAGAL
ncbi:glutaredoxin-like [Xenia sp. Carnegie-2017]|uniref:glutaredoxin-like n=1 Tax=Xenia sp. Carnegie-2017 TaxID=2897299 RepID=UPI001F049A73|nr:glutaredoxin-like [Xenia sp. Carnegie-2017]